MAYNNIKYETSIEDLQAMDGIFDNVRPDIEAQRLDLETMKQVYRRMPLYYKMLNWSKVEKVDRISFTINGLGGELFSTAYVMSAMFKLDDKRKFKRYEFDTIWYALAKAPEITMGIAKRVLDEVGDNRYYRNKGIHILDWGGGTNEWKKYAVDVMKMNPSLTDEVRLWLELQ
jgi:hypothetical protein